MKKFLKIAGVSLAAILLLMWVVPMMFSGKIGEIVKREANAMLNAKVEFSKLDISLFRHFPKASLELVDFEVTGVGQFEGEVLVAAERIELAVDLLSIFGDSFTISKVWLKAPQVNGHVLADGKANWDIMKPSEEAAPAEVVEESTEEESGEALKFSLESVAIEEASLSYSDLASKMHFHTKPLNLYLSGDFSADETSLNIAASAGDITFVSDNTSFASGLTASLEGVVAADFKHSRYTLSSTVLAVNSVKAKADGWVEMQGEDIVTDITLDCSNNNFKDILSLVPAFYTNDFEALTASGEVSLTAMVKGRMTATEFPAFDVKLSVDNGQFKYAHLPASVTNIALTAVANNPGGTLDATTVNVSRFGASFAGQSFSATASVATPMSDLVFKATAKGRLDLGAIKDVYPLEEGMRFAGIVTADASVGGRMSMIESGAYDRMSISGRVGVEQMEVNYAALPTIGINKAVATLSPLRMALEQLDVKIGASDVAATGSLTNYWGWLLHDTTLKGRLDVKSAHLDLNEIMAGLTSEESAEPAETTEPATDSAAEEPMAVIEVPKNLDLALNSSFDKVLFEAMVIEKVKGEISMRGGELRLNELSMNLFDGKAVASALYSTADKQSPKVSLNADFTNASFKTTFAQLELLQSLAPIFNKVDGTYTMSLKADMSLDKEMSPVFKSINGGGQIRSGNFKVSGVDALSSLATALNTPSLAQLSISEATLISFTINDGNITTKPFDIKVGSTKLTLSGLTGLDQSIDYKVSVATSKMTIHGKIGGTFTSPKVSLDAGKMVEEALSSVVGTSTAEVKSQISEEVAKRSAELVAEAEAAGAKLVEAAKAEGQKLVDKASNPLTKIAAQAAADKLVQEAEKQAAKLVEEAKSQAEKLQNK